MGLLKRLGIRFDNHTFGNLLKNFAPVAGAAAGGPAGMLLAGGMSAGGDAARGKSPGIRSAITNAGLAGGLGALKSAFVPSNAAYGVGDVAKGAGMMAREGLVHGAKAVGSAAVKNPLVTGQIASGVLEARAQGDATDLARQQFGLQQRAYDDKEARRLRLQQMLAPLLSSYAPGGM